MNSVVLVAGSANLDFVVQAEHVPAPGETIVGSDLRTFPGGKGANQAVACARAAGVRTCMLLALGGDDFALPVRAALEHAGVQLHVVPAPGRATGTALVCLADDGENAIIVAPGANHALTSEHLPSLDGVGYLLMQLEVPLEAVCGWAEAAVAAGVKVILNAAPARPLPQRLLRALDVLVVNEGELDLLARHAGIASMAPTVQKLQALAVDCVVVTLGARGCYAWTPGQVIVQPAFQVSAVDTTGAGDAFCGALTAALALHTPLPQALRRACAVSALACTRIGAQSGVPTHAEVQAFLDDASPTTASAVSALADYAGLAHLNLADPAD
jgi:ribokinase